MLERGDDEALAAATAALRRSQLRALVRGFALASLGVCAVVVASTSAWGASAPPVLAAGAQTPPRWGATRGAGGGWRVAPASGGGDRHAATASFSPAAAHASGFGELRVRSLRGAGNFSEGDRAFAAGMLEGYLTAQKIVETGKNLACEVRCDGSVPPGVRGFLAAQEEWIEERLSTADDGDRLWRFVRLLRRQYEGVLFGVEMAGVEPLVDPAWAVSLINNLGDLFDIKPYVHDGEREDFAAAPPDEASAKLQREGRCTSLFTVADDLSEIYFAHSSWFHYSNMNRVFKHYDLEWYDFSRTYSFSSYPGMLSSLDDFYLVQDTELVIIQTTNGIYNASVYDATTPFSLPAWARIRAANVLATDGADWAAYYGAHNSGTYNNQYQVLDLKRFAPGMALERGALTIVEQMPGLVAAVDATAELERGYFPSYNVPYVAEIYDRSGYASLDARRGHAAGYEYQQAPRAKILRRDHRSALSLDGMMALMRSNGYGSGDEFALDPWMAVCSRGDLNRGKASLAGCYDSKVSSASLFRAGLGAYVVNGPTNAGQPTFKWSDITVVSDLSNASGSPNSEAFNGAGLRLDLSASHLGQPDTFDFAYEKLAPAWADFA
ncbi:phospholipase B domain containing protein [Aureococcus anophagefferens]|uniref:Phospholipase B-like n=1 Tax=Aureococcus anophagefferens TaxID=44056 RepID=A0ABR1GDS5_AURAN